MFCLFSADFNHQMSHRCCLLRRHHTARTYLWGFMNMVLAQPADFMDEWLWMESYWYIYKTRTGVTVLSAVFTFTLT